MRRFWPVLTCILAAALLQGCETPATTTSSSASTRATGVPPPQQDIADRVARAIRAEASTATVTLKAADALHVELQGVSAIVGLANLKSTCGKLDRAACDAEIRRFSKEVIKSLGQHSRAEVAVRVDDIRVLLKNASDIDRVRAAQPGVALVPFVGGLSWVVVADLPQRMKMLSSNDLTPLGLTPKTAIERAARNMNSLAPLMEKRDPRMGGVVIVSSSDGYAAARLILTEYWHRLAKTVLGRLVLVAPARDVLAYTGDVDQRSVANLLKLGKLMVRREPYPLTSQPLVLTERGFELYKNTHGDTK